MISIKNTKFGWLLVLNEFNKKLKSGVLKSHCRCQCDCGAIKVV